MVLSLKEIIDIRETDTDIFDFLSNQIYSFKSQNADVENFLKEKAFDFEKRNRSRTFLCFDDNGFLLGYFSLSVKNIELSAEISKSVKKEIDGFKKDADSAVVFLIGELGRDINNSQPGFGNELLGLAIKYLLQAQSIIGMRYCLVETENSEENEKVINFYKNYGFTFLKIDHADEYQQLILRLNT